MKDITIQSVLFDCKKCDNSLSSPGSSFCHICPENSFFDLVNVIKILTKNKCQTCPAFFYSYMNSIGKESCRSIVCGDYNYKASETECKNYQKIITNEWDNLLLCINMNISS